MAADTLVNIGSINCFSHDRFIFIIGIPIYTKTAFTLEWTQFIKEARLKSHRLNYVMVEAN